MRGMGWHRDFPDVRDYSHHTDSVRAILKASSRLKPPSSLPPTTDLRQWCSPIEDQKSLGSCTANAAAGLLEYYERKAFGRHVDASRLFLYKVTRKLLGWKGDTGAQLRTAMQALVLFGAPPEKYWPYVESKFEDEPDAFCYQFASNYQTVQYYRLDPPGTSAEQLLLTIRQMLASGMPSMFGFTVYSSLGDGPDIPFPGPGDKVDGGHAIMTVGYDDKRKVGSWTGALLIRNSWGTSWGTAGYGWLPYQYVLRGLATDWWSLTKAEFADLKPFV